MSHDHEAWMRLAIEEAELARGTTGDNPWVGCVIVNVRGELLGRGHTLGPGADHREIAAARETTTQKRPRRPPPPRPSPVSSARPSTPHLRRFLPRPHLQPA